MMTTPPFDDLVRAHGARVWRVCRAVLGPADADDAWSETFLAALRAYPDLPADADHAAWLATIGYRKAVDAYRARTRRATPTEVAPDEHVSTLGQPGAADDELAGAVAALPDKQRLAVTLHYLADLPYAQVAVELGGTPEAARRAASDGIRRLRTRLAKPATTRSGALP
ncbi:MAG: sigma-70 family RNA polymerase sigma factor [Microlunatus sp.]|nr:sigma-70 family RNA polymerase sigma factor [Microlunatus sp.]MDN5769335.1 sigma-70 family RNA polymerase sigma factor [Microlunatus sp.]